LQEINKHKLRNMEICWNIKNPGRKMGISTTLERAPEIKWATTSAGAY